jgi:hypothetical protein
MIFENRAPESHFPVLQYTWDKLNLVLNTRNGMTDVVRCGSNGCYHDLAGSCPSKKHLTAT